MPVNAHDFKSRSPPSVYKSKIKTDPLNAWLDAIWWADDVRNNCIASLLLFYYVRLWENSILLPFFFLSFVVYIWVGIEFP